MASTIVDPQNFHASRAIKSASSSSYMPAMFGRSAGRRYFLTTRGIPRLIASSPRPDSSAGRRPMSASSSNSRPIENVSEIPLAYEAFTVPVNLHVRQGVSIPTVDHQTSSNCTAVSLTVKTTTANESGQQFVLSDIDDSNFDAKTDTDQTLQASRAIDKQPAASTVDSFFVRRRHVSMESTKPSSPAAGKLDSVAGSSVADGSFGPTNADDDAEGNRKRHVMHEVAASAADVPTLSRRRRDVRDSSRDQPAAADFRHQLPVKAGDGRSLQNGHQRVRNGGRSWTRLASGHGVQRVSSHRIHPASLVTRPTSSTSRNLLSVTNTDALKMTSPPHKSVKPLQANGIHSWTAIQISKPDAVYPTSSNVADAGFPGLCIVGRSLHAGGQSGLNEEYRKLIHIASSTARNGGPAATATMSQLFEDENLGIKLTSNGGDNDMHRHAGKTSSAVSFHDPKVDRIWTRSPTDLQLAPVKGMHSQLTVGVIGKPAGQMFVSVPGSTAAVVNSTAGHVGNGYTTRTSSSRHHVAVLRTAPSPGQTQTAGVGSSSLQSTAAAAADRDVSGPSTVSSTSTTTNSSQQVPGRPRTAVALLRSPREPRAATLRSDDSDTGLSSDVVEPPATRQTSPKHSLNSGEDDSPAVNVDRSSFCHQPQPVLLDVVDSADLNTLENNDGGGGVLEENIVETAVTVDAVSPSAHNRLAKAADAECLENNGDPGTIKDGTYFLQVVQSEEAKLRTFCELAEHDLEATTLPDDASGKVRAAIGKAHLLIGKKFKQFRELCDKNLSQAPDEPFSTTTQDLAGFWDMVMIQVDDVTGLFEEINELRQNHWISTKSDTVDFVPPSPTLKVINSKAASSSSANKAGKAKRDNATTSTTTPKTDMAKAREEARKRLLAAKAAGRQRKASEESEDIQIFIA